MTIEVCIVAYESQAVLEDAIRSIRRVIPGDPNIAIHDNSPSPATTERIQQLAVELHLHVRVEVCGTNCGFARACNSLAQGSSSELLLFLNPDAELLEWPAGLGDQVEGIVGPMVLDEKHRVALTWGRRRSILEEFTLLWARIRPRVPTGTGYVSGCALLVPRRLFLQLGGFDERFFMYYEDIDLCFRANEVGAPVRLVPSWKVRHKAAHSWKSDRSTALIRSYQSASYFYTKRGANIRLYRQLCRIDAGLRRRLFSVVPSRRNWVPALKQLSAYLAADAAKDRSNV
jgi:N-acetylglucosaminyl-diphospho-decaprenol L-rhamnosyltransferase